MQGPSGRWPRPGSRCSGTELWPDPSAPSRTGLWTCSWSGAGLVPAPPQLCPGWGSKWDRIHLGREFKCSMIWMIWLLKCCCLKKGTEASKMKCCSATSPGLYVRWNRVTNDVTKKSVIARFLNPGLSAVWEASYHQIGTPYTTRHAYSMGYDRSRDSPCPGMWPPRPASGRCRRRCSPSSPTPSPGSSTPPSSCRSHAPTPPGRCFKETVKHLSDLPSMSKQL